MLAWDEECAVFYAGIRHHLTAPGNLIGALDMMIAAQAMVLGAVVVTNNTRQYERVPLPLILKNWTRP